MHPTIIDTHFAKLHNYRYTGNGFFIYEGPVVINSEVHMAKKVDIIMANGALPPVKYNGSFVDTIPQ